MRNPIIDPAFPVPKDAVHTGMARRDYFAAIAVQGIAARGLEVSGDRVITEDEKNQTMATRAYALADAMIAAGAASLKKQPPQRKVRRRRRHGATENEPNDQAPAETTVEDHVSGESGALASDSTVSSDDNSLPDSASDESRPNPASDSEATPHTDESPVVAGANES